MIINYIILAHKEPRQLYRLVKKLYTATSFFYIHVDKNVEITPFQEVLNGIQNVIFLAEEKRIASVWGSPGLVLATLQAMREVVKEQNKGYTILLSGQCYPIKSNESIAAFLAENYGYNFIEGFALPDPRWPSSVKRMQEYAFFLSSKKEDFLTVPSFFDLPFKQLFSRAYIRKYLKVFLHFPVKSFVLFKKRRFPKGMKPVGGMQWWALPNDTIAFIIKYIDENPFYLKYHSYTLFSDEIFFQTLVHNFFEKTESPTTFSSWSEDEACSSPQTITSALIPVLKERRELFARKFEFNNDEKLFDLIDQYI